ncbi:2-dehydropantoate 2-reductase [Microlunatus speluncae]|uniref:2-dehydropantoate 2-reductase n=1 Tax=Microlunatus speluncae TaxID=2594267 RepID=UPI0012662C6D|nr:2-dehydropantoate 2-reductase [Microlunatus speluncae]
MKVCVYGAGSIGCYVGGRLAATGTTEMFVGRPRIADETAEHGLRLTDLHGAELRVPPDRARVITKALDLTGVGLVLVTVKSAATESAAAELADVARPGTVVISLQNGLCNAAILRRALPERIVLDGMVQFNVAHQGGGHFHAGTDGGFAVRADPALSPYLSAFERAGLPLARHTELAPVQWAKLLFNLNNAVNALSGLPLREELSDRRFRRCYALSLAEALRLLRRAEIPVARLTPLPPSWLPRLLTAPDAVFTRLAASMLKIDPHARSSMLDDLDAGRTTEVDELNGEVIRLAQRIGQRAPVNARLVELVRAAETGGRRSWTSPDLLAELRGAGTEP